MTVTRRALLGATAVLGVAPVFAATRAAPVAISVLSPGKRDHAAAIAAIVAVAQASLAATGLPGMALALRGPDSFAAELCIGWADLATSTPVAPSHRFEIGSISKSLVALTLWRLAGAGRIDLNAPVSRHLPGELLPRTPITAQQLLNHTAGLPNFAPPRPVGEERLWTGSTPGASFYYSNTGYSLAGLLIDAITGRPHSDVIAEQVLRPIGMSDARARIRSADRDRAATGYAPLREDLAPLYGSNLAEGPQSEEDLGAGAVAATVADMGAYLDYVLALGRGRGRPLLDDAAAARLLSPALTVPDPESGGGYSNGFMRIDIDGRPVLHHTGGMLKFASAFDADPAAGTGAFASVNGVMGEYRPVAVTAFAIQALRAAAGGRSLPAAPDPFARRRIERPERLLGRWVASDGAAIEIARGPLGPELRVDGKRGRLAQLGGEFATDLAGWDATAFELDGDSRDAAPTRLWHGERLFGRDAALPAPVPDPRLQALAGTYLSHDPWIGRVDVFARGDRLHARWLGEIVRDRGGYWRPATDPGGRERLRFDTIIAGKTHRLLMSGNPLLRIA